MRSPIWSPIAARATAPASRRRTSRKPTSRSPSSTGACRSGTGPAEPIDEGEPGRPVRAVAAAAGHLVPFAVCPAHRHLPRATGLHVAWRARRQRVSPRLAGSARSPRHPAHGVLLGGRREAAAGGAPSRRAALHPARLAAAVAGGAGGGRGVLGAEGGGGGRATKARLRLGAAGARPRRVDARARVGAADLRRCAAAGAGTPASADLELDRPGRVDAVPLAAHGTV